MLDGAQPHPPDDVAAGLDGAPVAGEEARGARRLREDARLRRDAAAVALRRDEEVHGGVDAGPDARADDDLARRVVGEVAEGGLRGHVEERLVAGRIQDALLRLPEAAAD